MVEGNDRKSIFGLIDRYNINFESDRRRTNGYGDSRHSQGMPIFAMIDFDDMIWIPLVENFPLPQFDVLFVDEAQDFNEMQRQMILRCVGNNRVVIVGDETKQFTVFEVLIVIQFLFLEGIGESWSRSQIFFVLNVALSKSVVSEANRLSKNLNAKKMRLKVGYGKCTI